MPRTKIETFVKGQTLASKYYLILKVPVGLGRMSGARNEVLKGGLSSDSERVENLKVLILNSPKLTGELGLSH